MLVMAYIYLSAGFPQKRLFMPLAVTVASVLLLKVFTHPIIDRMQTKESFFIKFLQKPEETVTTDPAVNTRATAWRYALGLIKDAPEWGVGVGNFPRLYSKAYPRLAAETKAEIDSNRNITTHNSYLYYTADLGGIPVFFLFLLVGWVLFKGFRSGHYCDAFPFWAGLVAVCIWAATNDYICERIFWIVLGVVSGLTHLRPENIISKTGKSDSPMRL
jgi:O-antigen ligase